MRFNNQLIDLPNLYHVIDRSPLTISPDSYVVDAVASMNEERSYILVVDKNNVLGIFTEKDVVKLAASGVEFSGVKISEVMTKQPVLLKQSEANDILAALLLFHQHHINHLPIVDHQEQLLGIVTETNLLKAFDLVAMVGVMEALQQNLQPLKAELRQVTPQIEVIRGQTHEHLRRWVEEKSAPVMQANQELRQKNQELAASLKIAELERQRYQDLFEFAPDGYLVTDVDGVIKEANHTAATMLTRGQKSLVGKPLFDFMTESDRDDLIIQLKKLQNLYHGEISLQPEADPCFLASIRVTVVTDYQGKQISWRWLLSNLSNFGDEYCSCKKAEFSLSETVSKTELPIVKQTSDLLVPHQILEYEIAERERIKEALRESETLYRQLVEIQTNLIIRADFQGGIIFANAAACLALGQTLDQLQNQWLFEFFHPDDMPGITDNLNLIIAPPYRLITNDQRLFTVNGVRYFQWEVIGVRDETGTVIELQGVGTDVTNRRQIEQALRESEERFRYFAENTHAIIWIHEPKSNSSLYVNPAYEKIWSHSCQSLQTNPQSWLEAIYPEDQARVLAGVEQQKLNQPTNTEYRIVQPDGSIRWIWDRGFPMQDQEGNIHSYGGIAEDITERKLSEETLRQSEERLTLALDTAQMGIWDWNYHTDTVIWSSNIGPLYGLPSGTSYPSQEDVIQLFHPEDRELWLSTLSGSIEQGTEYIVEYRVIWPDGSLHWLIGRGKPYYNDLGLLVRVIGTTRDITDRKQAEQKILEQAALLDIATDAIFVRDFQSQILFWNQGAQQIYGWKSVEALGKSPHQLFYLGDASRSEEVALKTVMEFNSWQGELWKTTKAGKKILVESRWTLMYDESGQPKSILTVDTDITDKKQLQAQIFRTQRLESLGTLAAGIAHDLNNILTPIIMSAQVLKLKFPHHHEQYQELLMIIENNAKRGAALVKQILTLPNGSKGERTIVQIKYLIIEVMQIAKHTFPKSINFSVHICEDLGTVFGDPTQLHQVLMNIILNARDAMPEGGTLTIETENLFIDEAYTRMHIDAKVGNYTVITISDTGVGMPPEILDRIFEPFFTTKEVGTGTGLGLYTVLGITKSHHGFMNVSSKFGAGTQFKLFLPSVEATQVLSVDSREIESGQGELILVVDDEPHIREIVTLVLEHHRYQILTASNGIEAIALYAEHKHRIQAVVMDLMMPEMSGNIAIRTLQKINDQVKIIACSGLGTLNKSDDIQVQALLSKPYTAKELLAQLSAVLRGDGEMGRWGGGEVGRWGGGEKNLKYLLYKAFLYFLLSTPYINT